MEKDTEDDCQMHNNDVEDKVGHRMIVKCMIHDNDVEDEVAHRMIVKCMHARGRIRFH